MGLTLDIACIRGYSIKTSLFLVMIIMIIIFVIKFVVVFMKAAVVLLLIFRLYSVDQTVPVLIKFLAANEEFKTFVTVNFFSSLLEIGGQRMRLSLYAHALKHFKGFVLCDNSQELMMT
ncbi:unnamed protein product [Porites lobata]|uniref:Uncharacterized protein n=1 Tax=Porites lobata TaxID=104759 RepID=A0ABN8RGN3_9CNID|nr:unnamed protein product [Porites lobata]